MNRIFTNLGTAASHGIGYIGSTVGDLGSNVVDTVGSSVGLSSKPKQIPVAQPIPVAVAAQVPAPVAVVAQVAAPEPSEPENPMSNIKEINFSFSDSLENILRNTDNLQTMNSAMKDKPLNVAIDLLNYIYVNKAIYFYNFNLKGGYDIDLIIDVIYNNDFKKTLNIKLSELATFYKSNKYNETDDILLITILEYFKRSVMGYKPRLLFLSNTNKNELYNKFTTNNSVIEVSFIPHVGGGKRKTRKNKKSKKSAKKNKSKKTKNRKTVKN